MERYNTSIIRNPFIKEKCIEFDNNYNNEDIESVIDIDNEIKKHDESVESSSVFIDFIDIETEEINESLESKNHEGKILNTLLK